MGQTPTPTPTPSPTPTPTVVSFTVPASTSLYRVPDGGRYDSSNLVLDPDGGIWSASANENVVAKLSPDGAKVTRWAFPTDAAPNSFLREPNGTFWMTETGGFKVAKFEPSTGTLTEWPDAARRPSSLVKRADGTFWLPETGGLLAKFDPAAGLFTYYKAVGVFSLSYPLADPDGTLWSCDFLIAAIVRYSADGGKATRWPLPFGSSRPSRIIRGPDGALWFTLYAAGQIGRFDVAKNEVRLYNLGPADTPYDIQAYKDRFVYTEQTTGYIGFLDPAASEFTSYTLTPTDITTTTLPPGDPVVPQTTTITPTTADIAPAASPVAVNGYGVPGLAVIPAANGNLLYGFVIDKARGRMFYGTSGNIGAIGPPLPINANDVYLPSAASIAGANGARYVTQLVTWNRATPDSTGATKAITFIERLLPSGWIAGLSPSYVATIPAKALVSQTDPIGSEMKGPDNFGALRASTSTDSVATDLFAWGRVSTAAQDGGSYGYSRNAVKADASIGAGQTGFFFCPPDVTQRVNAGFLAVDASKGTVSIVDPTGVTRASVAFDYPPGYHIQASQVFKAFGLDPIPSARVVFTVFSGRVLPFGVSVDPSTNDPIELVVFRSDAGATLQWLQGVARGAGSLGPLSTTDLQIFNRGTDAAQVNLQFLAASTQAATGTPASFPTFALTVPPGQVVSLPDVLGRNLGVSSLSGSLAVVSDKHVDAFARVTTTSAAGRYGFGIAALAGGESAAAGSRGVFIAATDNGFGVVQSDLVLTNPTYDPATVTLNATSADGAVTKSMDITLVGKEVRILPAAFYTVAGFGQDVGRLDVVPATGSASVFATLLRTDLRTGDVDAMLPFIIPK